MLDRIDLHIEVEPQPIIEMFGLSGQTENSAAIRKRVIAARTIQSKRFKTLPGIYCNAQMQDNMLDTFCIMEDAAKKFILSKADAAALSMRAYARILKVARTIADLKTSAVIQLQHVAEACQYRALDKPVTDVKRHQKDQPWKTHLFTGTGDAI